MSLPILSCEHLSKLYGTFPALSDLSLTLPKGQIVGLLGPNASGKTTLIKLVAGLLQPTVGEIRIAGLSPCAETRAIVSYLPDRCALPNHMSSDELVLFYARMFDDFDSARARAMLADLKVDTKKPVRTLSKGTCEKVQLILTMSRRARLYLLDEPIGGVDPATRDYILETILASHAPESTVLISTHLIADVEKHLSSFFFLSEGKIIASGDVKEFCAQTGETLDEAFRRMFRC